MRSFVFKPSKKFIFNTKNSPSDSAQHSFKYQRLSPAQIRFEVSKPVRPFNRFSRPKIADTGIDPSSAFIHFVNKDPSHPYIKSESSIYEDYNIKTNSPKIPVKLNRINSLSKEDIFQTKTSSNNYIFPLIKINNNNYDNKKNENNYLATDHISFRIPKGHIAKSFSKPDFPFLEMKRGFDINQESGSFWVPRNELSGASNRSSVDYNIISGQEEKSRQHIGIFEKKIFNKKKGIAEFSDYQKPSNINPNLKYLKRFEENKNRFKFYKGVFSDLYDSASKNGNMYLPFRTDNVKKKNV